jgi:hypothetical protein
MVTMELTEAEALTIERKRKRSEQPIQAVITFWKKSYWMAHCGCLLCGNKGRFETPYSEGRKMYCLCATGQKMRITETAKNYRPPPVLEGV